MNKKYTWNMLAQDGQAILVTIFDSVLLMLENVPEGSTDKEFIDFLTREDMGTSKEMIANIGNLALNQASILQGIILTENAKGERVIHHNIPVQNVRKFSRDMLLNKGPKTFMKENADTNKQELNEMMIKLADEYLSQNGKYPIAPANGVDTASEGMVKTKGSLLSPPQKNLTGKEIILKYDGISVFCPEGTIPVLKPGSC